jgi:undecaprenyl pyrophosphate synthase
MEGGGFKVFTTKEVNMKNWKFSINGTLTVHEKEITNDIEKKVSKVNGNGRRRHYAALTLDG